MYINDECYTPTELIECHWDAIWPQMPRARQVLLIDPSRWMWAFRHFIHYFFSFLFFILCQICEIKLSPLPFISSHQGSVHLKISYVDNDEECVVYKDEVPDTKKMTNSNNSTITAAAAATNQPASTTTTNTTTTTNNTTAAATNHTDGLSNGSNGGVHSNADGIVITLDKCRTLSGDIKVEFYMKPRISRKKTLFSFWFNTYFVSERENDGK